MLNFKEDLKTIVYPRLEDGEYAAKLVRIPENGNPAHPDDIIDDTLTTPGYARFTYTLTTPYGERPMSDIKNAKTLPIMWAHLHQQYEFKEPATKAEILNKMLKGVKIYITRNESNGNTYTNINFLPPKQKTPAITVDAAAPAVDADGNALPF
jgi:hypothetical protein